MNRIFVWKECVAMILMLLLFSPSVWADEKEDVSDAAKNQDKSVLIIGLNDNVKSNYFYNGMIAEETGINADSISTIYNRIIAKNIMKAAAKKKQLTMTTLPEQVCDKLLTEIKVVGENEDCYSDLSQIPAEEWKATLNKAHANYVLVLNRHYLKWQEEQLRTLFHIVSFSLFDKDKNEVYSGNTYFTSMNLVTPLQMEKTCQKSAAKIASNVLKRIE